MKLIGSSSSLEQLLLLIKEYFFSPNITLQYDKDHWLVLNSNGVIENFIIKKSKNRYRFLFDNNDKKV
jgi:hypothetical protein